MMGMGKCSYQLIQPVDLEHTTICDLVVSFAVVQFTAFYTSPLDV